MDKEQVKDIFNSFENGEYVESEEKLRAGLKSKLNNKLKDELGLEKDPIETEEDEEE